MSCWRIILDSWLNRYGEKIEGYGGNLENSSDILCGTGVGASLVVAGDRWQFTNAIKVPDECPGYLRVSRK